jgi:hypothetical protein
MDAFGSVPNALSYNILNSEGVLRGNWRLALSQVLRLAKEILTHCLHILNCLLNNNCLWKSVVKALVMNRHCGAVKKSLFSITEPMCRLVEAPVVTAVFLLARSEIAMSFDVHLSDVFIFFDVSLGLEDIFNCLLPWSCACNTKLEVSSLDSLRPLVVTLVALS